MYKIIVFMSFFIRNTLISNPFKSIVFESSCFFDDAINLLLPKYLSLIAEPFLSFFTFNIVGIYYRNRKFPAIGSILYLFFYFLHSSILSLIVRVNFEKMTLFIVFITYVSFHFIMFKLKSLFINLIINC